MLTMVSTCRLNQFLFLSRKVNPKMYPDDQKSGQIDKMPRSQILYQRAGRLQTV